MAAPISQIQAFLQRVLLRFVEDAEILRCEERRLVCYRISRRLEILSNKVTSAELAGLLRIFPETPPCAYADSV